MSKKFVHNTDIGQNFLRDLSIVDYMMKRAKLGPDDYVLEIGAGEGALTKGILSTPCGGLTAIEIDTRLAAPLAEIEAADERFRVVFADVLKVDLRGVLERTPNRVIANLPYHITTPVIWRMLEEFAGEGLRYMLLMVQWEAALRLSAEPRCRDRSPLGITLDAVGSAKVLRKIPRSAFFPAPQVDSALIEIVIGDERASLPHDARWRRLLAESFRQRRKTLVNNWKALGVAREGALAILEEMGLAPTARPEELTLTEWLALYDDKRLVF